METACVYLRARKLKELSVTELLKRAENQSDALTFSFPLRDTDSRCRQEPWFFTTLQTPMTRHFLAKPTLLPQSNTSATYTLNNCLAETDRY